MNGSAEPERLEAGSGWFGLLPGERRSAMPTARHSSPGSKVLRRACAVSTTCGVGAGMGRRSATSARPPGRLAEPQAESHERHHYEPPEIPLDPRAAARPLAAGRALRRLCRGGTRPRSVAARADRRRGRPVLRLRHLPVQLARREAAHRSISARTLRFRAALSHQCRRGLPERRRISLRPSARSASRTAATSRAPTGNCPRPPHLARALVALP